MKEAARQTGVSYDVIRELHRRPGSTTSAENAEKLVAALEMERTAIPGSAVGNVSESVVGTAPPGVPSRVEPGAIAPPNTSLVQVYDVAASAGYGAMIDTEEATHSLAFPPAYLKRLTSSAPTNLAIISVQGESMEPTLLDHDIVLLDMSKKSLSYDGLFVLRFDDALHVKRIGRSARRGHVMIISDNKDLYPPIEAPAAEVEAVGRVLWYGRKV